MTKGEPDLSRRAMFRLGRGGSARASSLRETAAVGDLVRVSRPAMGSTFELRIPASTPAAVDLAYRALDLIDLLEAQLTVYSDDSEVSQVNARAHLEPVPVSAMLFDLLESACAISRDTQGAYDVTSGALSEAWGFVRGPKRVPEPEVLSQALARTGYEKLRLDPETRTVAFAVEGLRINLGSIGKGYALDRARLVLESHWWPTGALIHGGRSSALALGSPAGPGSRWRVALRNPFCPEHPLGEFRLRNRAIGTSGAAFQSFESGGKLHGHIIDPRSGAAILGPASVTVLAPTAAAADALSTAFYLLGPSFARDYLATRPALGAVFVLESTDPENPTILALGSAQNDFFPGEIPVD